MSSIAQQTVDEDFRLKLQDYGLKHDAVTGLPNRSFFRSWIQQTLADAAEDHRKLAVVWVDVLNVRREYSIGGDAVVNRLICNVADVLRPWIEAGEMACRFSDHTFLLVLDRNSSLESRLTSMLCGASDRSVQDTEGKPRMAAGVANFPEHTSSAEELVRFACLAADVATRTRSRTATTFAPAMNTSIQSERDLEKDLRRALQENQLSLVYQPQIDLVTGNTLGVEGLMRWIHPQRGPVSPAQFIPIAERSDLIDEIFSYSLRRMLVDVAAWRKAGVVLPSAAVNASPANVRHEDFVSIVKRELASNPPGNTQLDIEVTESLLMDDEQLFVERLTNLRRLGVKVSLDDFGTRYTGFNALKGLPLSTMKIDRCFVHGIDRSNQAQSLCRTIVTMARHLHLLTVAEGIEEPGELKTLQELGCMGAQGYLFQRPVRSDEFVECIRNWPQRKLHSEFCGAFHDPETSAVSEVDMVIGLG